MKSRAIVLSVLTLLALVSSVEHSVAYEAYGWSEIRMDLWDGAAEEYVKPIPGLKANEFYAETEWEAVMAAANWVAYHMAYESDPYPPGEVWTSSDQQYEEIAPGSQGSGTGDCEDFAILLCALLRFHTQGGIPASRVWVQAGIIVVPDEDKPPVFGHAYVVYKTDRGIFYIEPQWGGFPYRGSPPSILHWYYNKPPMTGESATLRFNDGWVKGGGPWLAGPRNK